MNHPDPTDLPLSPQTWTEEVSREGKFRKNLFRDLLLVLLLLGAMLGYLLASLAKGEGYAHELPPLPAPLPSSSLPPSPYPWKIRGEPVPSEVLYTPDSPAPPVEVKRRSLFNRIFFPAQYCPYCGHRIPTEKGSYFFLILGLLGQLAFTMRFFVQWIASERARASVVPESFWWFSIVGSALLLLYAFSIFAIPIVLGQLPNVFIYGRNLYFIRKRRTSSSLSPS